MSFDVQGARQAGYSDREIADYLGESARFDTNAARTSGYGDIEIIEHLSPVAAPPPAAVATPQAESSLWDVFTDSASRGWRGLQQTLPAIRATNRSSVLNELDAIDRGEQLAPEQLGLFAEQYLAASPEQRIRIRRAFGTEQLPAAIGEDITKVAQLEAEKRAFPAPASVNKAMQAQSFGEALGLIGEHPLEFLASIGPESIVQSLPGIAAGIPASLLGPAGPAATLGANSFATEMSSGIIGELAERGINTSDPQAIQRALSDRALLDEITSKLAKRAAVVGGVDALSGGVASKTMLPAKVLAERQGVRKLAEMAVQTPIQGALGAAGEAGGQLAAGEELRPGEILAEAVGELAGAPIEVAALQSQLLKDAIRGQNPQPESTPAQIDAILGRTQSGARVEPATPDIAQTAADAVATARAASGLSPETTAPTPDTIPPPATTGSPPPASESSRVLAPTAEAVQGSAITAPLQPELARAPIVAPAVSPQPPPQAAPIAAPAIDTTIPKTEAPPAPIAPPELPPASAPQAQPVTEQGDVSRVGGVTATDTLITAFGNEQRAQQFQKLIDNGSSPALAQAERMKAKLPAPQQQAVTQWQAQRAPIEQKLPPQREASPDVTISGEQPIAPGYTVSEGDENAQAEFDRLLAEQRARDAGRPRVPERVSGALERRGRSATTSGPGRTAAGSVPNPAWRASTTVRSRKNSKGELGKKPLTVYRGGKREVGTSHFTEDALGRSTGHPSSGLGVYFTDNPNEAARYGEVREANLDIRNPKIYDGALLPGFDSVQEAMKLSRELQAQGYDGIIIHNAKYGRKETGDWYIPFAPEQVIHDPGVEESPTEQAPPSEPSEPEVTEGTAEDITLEGDDDTLALRRAPKPKAHKGRAGPYSATREGEIRASALDQLWIAAGLDPNTIENAPASERFARASEIIKQHFGFAAVKKDPALNDGEAVDVLKDAYVGLANYMAVMNANPALSSLEGTLTLRLSRDEGAALASYNPGSKTITMVRRNDAFAHEHAHAIDDWLLNNFAPELHEGKGQLLTGKIRQGGEPKTLKEEVTKAYIDVLNSMYFDRAKAALYVDQLQHQIAKTKGPKQKAKLEAQLEAFNKGYSRAREIESDYYKHAKQFDGGSFEGGSKAGYWQKPTEMFARAHEAYIAHKLDALGADHPFVTQSDRMYRESRIGEFNSVYPNTVDRDAIFAAFDNLYRSMRDHNLVNTDNAPAALDATDTKYWKKQAPNLTPDQSREARGVLAKLSQPFKEQLAELHRADAADRERARQDQKLRDAKLNAVGREGLRRFVSNVGMTVVSKTNALASGLAHSIRGVILSLEEKHAGNQGIKQLREWFATDPGSGRRTGKVYSEEVRTQERLYQNRFGNIVENHKIKGYSDPQLRQLRDVLVNAISAESVSPQVRNAAADLRRFMNDMYAYNQQHKVDIGYAKNGYLPRVPDALRIENDLLGFRKQARKLYEKVYDTEIGTPNELLDSPDKLNSLLKYVGEIAKGGNVPEARTIAAKHIALAKQIRKLQKDMDDADDGGTSEQRDQLADLVTDLHTFMRAPWAMEAANDWELRIRGMGQTADFQFESRGPGGKYTKARTLPTEADAIMGDYLVNDPLSLISTYISQSVQRVQFGQFFGNPEGDRPLGWKLADAMDAVRNEYTAADGSKQRVNADEAEELQKSVDLLTGRYNTNVTRLGLRVKSKLTAFFTPVILARSLWSQLAEPTTTAIRTGDVTDGVRVIYSQLQDVAGKLGIKSAQQRAEWRNEMAEYFGVVTNHLTDQIMQSRYNLLYQSSSDNVKLSRFFHVIGVHPHAMSMRRGVVQVFMTRYAPKMAERAKGTDAAAKQAREALAELGIDSSNRELLDELASLADVQDSATLDKFRHIDQIRTAINRFTDEAIADPKVIDKPRHATQPEWSFMYGLLSFQYAFQRNIVLASLKRIEKAWKNDATIGAKTTASIAVGFASLMAAQLASSMLRSLLFSGDDWEDIEEKTKEDWLWQSATRAGLFGAADPVVNAFLGIKYERDLSSLALGPLIAMPVGAAQTGIKFWMQNSANTPNAEYKATEALWNTALAPLVTSKALSIAGANPYVDAALGVGLPFLTSKRVSGVVAEGIAEGATDQEYKTKAEKRAEAESPEGKAKAQRREQAAKRKELKKQLGLD